MEDITLVNFARTTISIPSELYNEFDDVLHHRKNNSKSKGIRDAIGNYIRNYKWINEMAGEKMGTVGILYEQNHKNVIEDLANLEHNYNKQIKASMNIYISQGERLQVIIVKGDIKYIKNFANQNHDT